VFFRSITDAIANTREMTQLNHNKPVCQVIGPRRVFRNSPTPVAIELTIALLNRN